MLFFDYYNVKLFSYGFRLNILLLSEGGSEYFLTAQRPKISLSVNTKILSQIKNKIRNCGTLFLRSS